MTHVKFLQYVCINEHLPRIMRGRDTHEAALKFAFNAARLGCVEPEDIKEVLCASLPADYKGNTREEIDGIIESAFKKIALEPPRTDAEAESQKAKLMAILESETFFHDSNQRGYMFTHIDGAPRTLLITSKECERLLQHRYYHAVKSPIGANPLREALQTLEARALFDGDERRVYMRHAFHGDSLLIDLGDKTGHAVKISPSGVEIIVPEPPVHFIRPTSIASLPQPVMPGDIEALKRLLDLPQRAWLLVLAFIIGCYNLRGPYPVLIIEGEQGSGKTILSRMIKKIVDPFSVELTRAPKDEEDLLIHAENNFLLGFDNLSGMSNQISDAFCRLATGGGIITRKLYTNSEPHIFENCRPVIMNGISDIATRPDLLERSIMVKMEPIDSSQRKTEAKIYEAFTMALPGILGALYSVVSAALRELPKTQLKEMPRMADFARFITAAEKALGLKKDTFIRVLDDNQIETTTTVIENYPLADCIISLAYDKPFVGTVAKLYAALPYDGGGMPRSTSSLSKTLKRLRPALKKQGVLIEFQHKSNKGRIIKITVTDDYKKNVIPWHDPDEKPTL